MSAKTTIQSLHVALTARDNCRKSNNVTWEAKWNAMACELLPGQERDEIIARWATVTD